jgi:phosphoglycolate phosphatase
MSQFPFAMVGFDLDGTLVDTNRDLAPAINHALVLAGREPVPPEETHSLVGAGGRVMLARAFEATGNALPDAELDPHFGNFLDYYAAHIAIHSVPYPGCFDALDALAGFGCTLSVVTNKSEALAVKLLDQLGMLARFACVIGGDTAARSKPHADPIELAIARSGGAGRFAMVGDSSFDVHAAHAAGAPAVALSFGYNDRPVHELGADAVIDHFDELVGALRAL